MLQKCIKQTPETYHYRDSGHSDAQPDDGEIRRDNLIYWMYDPEQIFLALGRPAARTISSPRVS